MKRTIIIGWMALLFTAAVRAGDADLPADYLAGVAALEDGFYGIAAERLEAAIPVIDDRDDRSRAYLMLVQALFGTGQYQRIDELMTEHAKWVARTDEAPDFAYWHARSLFLMNRLDEALARLDADGGTYDDPVLATLVMRLRGSILEGLKRYPDAWDVFRMFDETYGDTDGAPDNLLQWGLSLRDAGRMDEAVLKMEEISERFPGSEADWRSRLWRARVAKRDDTASVIALLEPMTADTSTANSTYRAEAWFTVSRAEKAAGRLTEALEAIRKGIALAPLPEQAVDARLDEAQMLIDLGRPEEAVTLMETTLKAGPPGDRARTIQLDLAGILAGEHRYEDALTAYQQYLEAFPDSPNLAQALSGKALCLRELGRFAEAAITFEKAAAAGSASEQKRTLLLQAGDAYHDGGQYKLAVNVWTGLLGSVTNSPDRQDLQTRLAESHAAIGDYSKAEDSLRRCMAINPDSLPARQALLRIAGMREDARNWEGAIEIYQEFIEAYPESDLVVHALMGRAMLRFRLGQLAEALDAFEDVEAAYPGTPWEEQAFYMKGRCLYQRGNTREALMAGDAFLQRYPASPWAPEVMFWMAQHRYNSGEFPVAETRLLELVDTYPANEMADDALYWAGRAAAEQKEFKRAIDFFNRLTKEYTNSIRVADARYAQGDALSEMGEYAGAILAYDEILRKYPASPLADAALGRKADCQFTLGSDRPERYLEASASYKTLLNSPTASLELRLQAETKLGRTYEKLDRRKEAFESYMNVVYNWLAAREKGEPVPEVWFIRAAFYAAAMKEADGAYDEAVVIYRRVIDAGVAAAPDAAKRIETMTRDRSAATANR